MTRHLLPALLCTLALACDRSERFDAVADHGEDPAAATPDPPPSADFRWDDAMGQLPALDRLATAAVQEASDGPWALRSAGGSAMGPGGPLRATSRAPGGPMPEGAAAPMLGGAIGGATLEMGFAADGDMAMPASEAPVPTVATLASKAKGGRGAERPKVPSPGTSTAPLRAGSTDDNADLDAWIQWQAEEGSRFVGNADQIDVTGRRELTVRGAEGRPVPGARVSIIDRATDQIIWSARSMGDGRVPIYPQLVVPGVDGGPLGKGGPGPAGWTVQVEAGDELLVQHWDAAQAATLEARLDAPWTAAVGPTAARTVPVDVCFVIDTTGSMGDEIAQVKATLLQLTEKLRAESDSAVDLRYSAVLYRDLGDAYVTKTHAFTADLQGFDAALQGIQASGGGDGPESLNQGLAVATAGMEWRDNAAKVAFLIADAPPHMDYQEDVSYGRAAAAALARGIKVHTVAASGLDSRGSLVFRQIAQLSRGQFIFVEYGSNAASAASHGVGGPTGSNNLDAILYGRIRAEIDGWGRDLTVLSQR